MNSPLPHCFYRISVKALVLDPSRERFLVMKEENGKWDLPGGGLDWDMTPEDDLRREIREEMGLELSSVADHPSYFIADCSNPERPKANVLYEATLDSRDFTPSEECVEIRFVTPEEARSLDLYENVREFAGQFDYQRHA